MTATHAKTNVSKRQHSNKQPYYIPANWEMRLLKIQKQVGLESEAIIKKKLVSLLTQKSKPLTLGLAYTLALVKNTEANITTLKNRQRQLSQQIKQFQTINDLMMTTIIHLMQRKGIMVIKSTALEGTLCKVQSEAVITDEKLLPKRFFKEKIIRQINKALIKATLSQGQLLPGACLKAVHSLKVKP